MLANYHRVEPGETVDLPSDMTSRQIKLVVVGDGTVGKTCLLLTFATGSFFEGVYTPSVWVNHAGLMEVDGVRVSITLWDTGGQGDYDRLRPLSYPDTDGFLLCFSVDNNRSCENIATKWHPEIKHHCPRVPYILVGTKTDLRDGCGQSKDRFVSHTQGKKMASEIKAYKYMECSAKEITGVKEVFEEAVRAVLSPKQSSSILHQCVLL